MRLASLPERRYLISTPAMDSLSFFVFGAQRQRRAVEECAFAAFGIETFAADWIVNHAQFGVAVFNQRDGYGKMRQTVDEVVCAIDRVDNPQAV